MAPRRDKAAAAASKSSSQSAQPAVADMVRSLKALEKSVKWAVDSGEKMNVPDTILDTIEEMLRSGRRDVTPHNSTIVRNIIADLNSKGNDACSRLGSRLHGILLRLFLLTSNCPEVERGLCLLAVPLYYKSSLPSEQHADLIERKVVVAQLNFELLQEFFTDTKHPVALRRWAGIILIQLLQNCVKNFERVQFGSNSNRQCLGKMVLVETNEVVRVICGQLIRLLIDGQVEKEALWPAEIPVKTYEGFPDSSQPGRWNQRFQDYLEDLETRSDAETPSQGDFMYFAQDVDTLPTLGLERLGHTTYVDLSQDVLCIWSPAMELQADQFLEIPLEYVLSMNINSNEKSQVPDPLATFTLNIEDKGEGFCSLNGTVIDIKQVRMHLYTDDATNLHNDLLDKSNYAIRQSQNSIVSSSDDAIVFDQQGNHYEPAPGRATKNGKGKEKEILNAAASSSPIEEFRAEGSVEEHIGDNENVTSSESQLKQKYTNPKIIAGSTGRVGASANRKAKKPIDIAQRSTKGKKIQSDPTDNSHSTGHKDKGSAKSASEEILDRDKLTSEFEGDVSKLARIFPAASRELLRGVLITVGGNIDKAADSMLRRNILEVSPDERITTESKIRSSTGPGKIASAYDSEKFTSPEAVDASTPKQIPGNKNAFKEKSASEQNGTQKAGMLKTSAKPFTASRSKYSLKAKPSIGSGILIGASTESQEKSKASTAPPRIHLNPRMSREDSIEDRNATQSIGDSIYELPEDEGEPTSNTGARTKGKVPAKKASTATKKTSQKTKEDTKNRPSAVPVKAFPVAVRGKRVAAKDAIKKHINSNHNEEEINQIDEKESSIPIGKSQIRRVGNASQISKSTVKASPPEKKIDDDHILEIEGTSADLGDILQPTLGDNERHTATKEIPEVQAERRTKQLTSISEAEKAPKMTAKSSSQIFASKLGTMVGVLDEHSDPEGHEALAINGEADARFRMSQGLEPAPADMTKTSDDKVPQEVSKDGADGSTGFKPRSPDLDADEKSAPENIKKRNAAGELKTPRKRRRIEGDNLEKDHKCQVETVVETVEVPLSENLLVDEHRARKPQIVAFGNQGANNQGTSSVLRNTDTKIQEVVIGQQAAPSLVQIPKISKHARVEDNYGLSAGPPPKRQSLSPDRNDEGVVMDHCDMQEVSSSPPPRQQTKGRTAKSSSQASWIEVDCNGSPKAKDSAKRVDHISMVRQKLLGQKEGSSTQPAESVLEPRLKLAGIPKTGPSSPRGFEARYIKSHKLADGIYKNVVSQNVVTAERTLADPFVGGPARRSSDFAEKLQAGVSRETKQVQERSQEEITFQAPKKVLVYDDQPTLVNSEPDLTSGSSEDDSTSTLSGKHGDRAWNLTFRPHYENIAEIAHQVAEEVIIRLSNEEHAMGLLVKQFSANGEKHLGSMIVNRGGEKDAIALKLDGQKDAMVAMFAKSKVFVNDSETFLRSKALPRFEVQWRKEQERIQRKIAEGRNLMD